MMRVFVILVATVVSSAVSAAEGEPQAEPKKSKLYVGAGAVISSKPYEGIDSKIYGVPILGYEGDRLYLRGISGGYRLLRHKGWSVGPMLRPRFEGYDASDSRALSGMDDRRRTLEAGLDLSWQTDWGLLSAVALTDLLGEHDGQEIEFSYTVLLPYAGFNFIPSVGLRWRSDDLVDYYYGVRPDEARAGRPAYVPGATLTPVVRLAVRRKVSTHWGLLLGFQYEWLDSEITDSPIVEDSTSLSLLVGAAYAF
jgi:outer membrane protein